MTVAEKKAPTFFWRIMRNLNDGYRAMYQWGYHTAHDARWEVIPADPPFDTWSAAKAALFDRWDECLRDWKAEQWTLEGEGIWR